MSTPKQFHVAANLPQDFTADEKAQARENIGAAASGEGSIIEQYEGSSAYGPIYTKINKMTLGNGGLISTDLDSDGLYGILPPVPTVPGKVLKSGTNTVEWGDADASNIEKYVGSSAYEPIYKKVDKLRLGNGGLVSTLIDSDNELYGILPPVPSVPGKVLKSGSSTVQWVDETLPTIIEYLAGTGIASTENPQTGNITFSWDYSVGRNLSLNQNKQIQTNLPGGIFNAPAEPSNSFSQLGAGSDFAGAYRLMCRHKTNGTYELGIQYTASGTSSSITFTGTETVIAIDNSLSIHPAAYIAETTYYTPSTRFGGNESTVFDPSLHKAIIYNGLAQIGPTSDCKIAIWQDNGSIKISFTAIEVGKIGSTI